MSERPQQKRRFRSVSIYWLLPNMLTVAGFASGLTALRFAMDGRWAGVIILISVAAVFDALDGRTARRLQTSSAFGAALDSLSDLVVFGVVPTLCLYIWALQMLARWHGGQRYSMRFQLRFVWRGLILSCLTRLIMPRAILRAFPHLHLVFLCYCRSSLICNSIWKLRVIRIGYQLGWFWLVLARLVRCQPLLASG
jgi:hypothetical protein